MGHHGGLAECGTSLALFGKSFINIARSDVGRVALFLSRRRGPQHLLLAPDLIVALNVLAQSAVVFFECCLIYF